jgi:hypothetical protein
MADFPVRRTLACLAVALAFTAARASQVRLVNLEEMTLRAERIFSGRCLQVESAREPALGGDVTVATFEVLRAVKGAFADRITVRMPAVDDGRGGGTAGVPGIKPGDEVVLFLYGESASGLTAPVGLGQGRFRILTDKQGRRIAVNDFANRNLLRGLAPAAQARLEAAPAFSREATELEPSALLDMAEALSAPVR